MRLSPNKPVRTQRKLQRIPTATTGFRPMKQLLTGSFYKSLKPAAIFQKNKNSTAMDANWKNNHFVQASLEYRF